MKGWIISGIVGIALGGLGGYMLKASDKELIELSKKVGSLEKEKEQIYRDYDQLEAVVEKYQEHDIDALIEENAAYINVISACDDLYNNVDAILNDKHFDAKTKLEKISSSGREYEKSFD